MEGNGKDRIEERKEEDRNGMVRKRQRRGEKRNGIESN
jgi:hypothetical protein